jgi:hypothetical protein
MSAPAVAEPKLDSDKRSTQTIAAEGFAPPRHRNATPEAVARLAYTLWQNRGCSDGSAELDWLEAERRLSDFATMHWPSSASAEVEDQGKTEGRAPDRGPEEERA